VLIGSILFGYLPGDFAIKQWIYYGVFAAAIPFMFQAFRRNTTDKWVGELSYPVYMSHMLILDIVGYGGRWPYIPEKYLAVVICAGSIAFSVVLVKLVIERMEKVRQSRMAASRDAGCSPLGSHEVPKSAVV
jgi:peptidoglycan/LPS O-acetylase OafA/YrhL